MPLLFFIKFKNPLKPIAEWIAQPIGRVTHITDYIAEERLVFGLKFTIASFLLGSTVILSMILIRRLIMLRQAARAKVLRERYENYLSEIMTRFEENGKVFYKINFNTYLSIKDQKNAFHRRVLKEQILTMRRHVGGFEAENLQALYIRLGFDKEALNTLKDRKWYRRLEAVQELSLMTISSLDETFQIMSLDEHQLVRVAALRDLILRGRNWQQALMYYNYNLSLWEQYQICDALSRRQAIELPDFRPLLSSLNPSIIVFGLKMIKMFHSMEALPNVEPFLYSKDPAIVQAAKDIMEQFGLDFEIANEDLVFDLTDLHPPIVSAQAQLKALKSNDENPSEDLIFEILD